MKVTPSKEEIEVEESELAKVIKEEEGTLQKTMLEEVKEVQKKALELKKVEVLPFEDDYIGDDWVLLRWTYPYPDPNFDRYVIYASTSPNELGPLLIDRITNQFKNRILIGNLSPKTTYYFTIRAYDKYGKFTEDKIEVTTKSKWQMRICKFKAKLKRKLPKFIVGRSLKDIVNFYKNWYWARVFGNDLHIVYKLMCEWKLAGRKLTPRGEELFQQLCPLFDRSKVIYKKPEEKKEEEKPLIQETLHF